MPDATMTVKLDEQQAKRLIAKALERIKASLVLTWHPVAGGPAEEIPFNTHWSFPADVVGEFTLSTRHGSSTPGEPESDDDVECPHPLHDDDTGAGGASCHS